MENFYFSSLGYLHSITTVFDSFDVYCEPVAAREALSPLTESKQSLVPTQYHIALVQDLLPTGKATGA